MKQDQNEKKLISKEINYERSDKIHSFYNLFKSSLGSGILAVPFAMNHCGYALGSLVLIFLTLISMKSMNNLLEIAD